VKKNAQEMKALKCQLFLKTQENGESINILVNRVRVKED